MSNIAIRKDAIESIMAEAVIGAGVMAAEATKDQHAVWEDAQKK